MYTRVWHVYIYVIFCEVLSVLASVFSCEFVWTTVSLRSIRACSVWSRRRKTVWQRGTWIKWHRDDGDGDDDGGEKGRKKRRRREKKVRSPRISVRRRKAWHTGISSIANSHRRKRRRRGCAAAAVSLLCVCVFERLETPRDHGSALLRDYWDWVQSLRWSSPSWWWPCAAKSTENRGKIRAQQFLLRVRAEGHLAAHAQDCRGVDVRGEQLFPVHVSPLNFPKFTHLSYFIASCTII